MKKAKAYLLRTKIKGEYYYFSRKVEYDSDLTVVWTRKIQDARQFASAEDIKVFKEDYPVIKGNTVIYKRL